MCVYAPPPRLSLFSLLSLSLSLSLFPGAARWGRGQVRRGCARVDMAVCQLVGGVEVHLVSLYTAAPPPKNAF